MYKFYIGVHRNHFNDKWEANIYVNGEPKFLGYFETEIEAAKAYNEAAKIHYKNFAVLNIIPGEENES
jgi:hypothetical protein